MYGTYIPPPPKYLLIKNQGKTLFSEENVLRKTAWLGRILNITDRSLLPEMRKIEYLNDKDETIKAIAIKTETTEQAKTLLEVTKIGPHKVKVEKDTKKNTIYGVLFDTDSYFKTQNITEEEMEKLLASEGVLSVRKIGKDASRSYKVLFDKLEIPQRVKILGERRSFPISNFIPNPLRCFKCQAYDHSKTKCRKPTYTCQRCGGEHQNKRYTFTGNEKTLVWECSEIPFCVNCKQGHEAGDPKCIRQQEQKEINSKMVNQKISRYEAKNRVLGPQAISNSRAIITAQKLEQKETEVTQSNEVIDDIHKKLEQITTQMEKSIPDKTSENTAENIDDKIIKAVALATEKMQEKFDIAAKTMERDFNQKLQQVQSDLAKQTETINKLLQDNNRLKEESKTLKAENKTLHEQLKAEKDKNDKLQKENILKRKPTNNTDNSDPKYKVTVTDNRTTKAPTKTRMTVVTNPQKTDKSTRPSKTNINQA